MKVLLVKNMSLVLQEFYASFRMTRSKSDLKSVPPLIVCVGFPMLSPSQDNYSSQCVSQPPTPSPLSPSPASLSSYQGDDSDSISSPAWPKNPSSPVSASCHLLFIFLLFFLLLWFDGVSCFDLRYDEWEVATRRFVLLSPVSFQQYPVPGKLF